MTNQPLHNYQERLVNELLAEENPKRYLAVDMGLGKTRVVLEYLRRSGRKAFVLAPLLVAQNTWPAEIAKWTPEFKHCFIHGDHYHKRVMFKRDVNIKLMNYDGLKWLGKEVAANGSGDLKNRVLVLDEATFVKSPSTQRFKTLKSLLHLFKSVICLSGSPMPNGYAGLWSQYYMLDQGRALCTAHSYFMKKFFYESGPPRFIVKLLAGADKAIQAAIAPMTSVLRAQDWLELPERLSFTEEVSLDSATRKLYDGLKKKYVVEHESFGNPMLVGSAGTLVNKLHQVAQGFLYGEDGEATAELHTLKLDVLELLVEQAQGDPILCPIHFKHEIAMLHRRFPKAPVIAGGMTVRAKAGILKQWDAGTVPLLLCHPASLSHGVNMQTGGHIMVWYSMPWSLEHYTQLNARLVRQGQTKPVKIYHIVARGTVDQRIMQVLKNKSATQNDFKRALLAECDDATPLEQEAPQTATAELHPAA